ncbi:MAG TPA: DUF3054 domain-containing protein [Chloroflexaceae bacterium]|nr:DUF3054 domain-containing protein [Chloroflexaceae bacterium]
MSTETSRMRPPGGRAAALVAGDVVALLLFAALGRRSHGEAAGLAALGEVALTALPFIAGWLAVAPWAGAFSPARTAGLAPMLRATLLGWAGALLVGALARAALIGRFSPASFYVVTFLVALLMLGAWRAAFALAEGRGKG